MGATVAPAAAVANFPHSPPFPSSLFDELFLKEEEGEGGVRGERRGRLQPAEEITSTLTTYSNR